MSSKGQAASKGTNQQEANKDVKDLIKKNSVTLESKVMGLAILDRSLFVVCKNSPQIIFKFDLDAPDQSFSAPVELSVSKVVWPRGIAASEKLSCLYITDWCDMFGGKLWRYKYKKGKERIAEPPVAALNVQPFGVSVSPRNDEVLVTCATPANFFMKRGWIYIYKSSGDEFSLVRKIDLPDLEIPRHAILTSSSLFIVCHGWTLMQSHGVTSLQDDRTARTGFPINKKSFYGRARGSGNGLHEMNRPLSLAFLKNQMILVVDYGNHRVQLLTEDLQLVRHILTKEEHSIEHPRHVCQDPSNGRLYVSQDNGEIHIFE